MNCPKCDYPQYCPCKSCQDRGTMPEGFKPWVWIDGENLQCANCGFKARADWWEDRELRSYQASREDKG